MKEKKERKKFRDKSRSKKKTFSSVWVRDEMTRVEKQNDSKHMEEINEENFFFTPVKRTRKK
jgi:hypothetical protein